MAAYMFATTDLLAVRINNCQHLTATKNSIFCFENWRILLEILNESHGELPKGHIIIVTCNTSTDTNAVISLEVKLNLLVGDLVTSFNVKRLEFTCSKEKQTMDGKNAARFATKQALNAFQVLMAGGGGGRKLHRKLQGMYFKEIFTIYGI